MELLDFRGESLAEGNHLQWTTGSEIGAPPFHRGTQQRWPALLLHRGGDRDGKQPASLLDYNFIDRTAPDGISYYRLRMVDLDANEDLSNVIAALAGPRAISSSSQIRRATASHGRVPMGQCAW